MSDPSITTDSASGPSPEAIAALNTPDPVKITPREAPKEEVKKPSLRESMDLAKAKLEAKDKAEVDPKALKTKEPTKEAPAKVDPKAVDKTPVKAVDKTAERARGEHGHFAPDPTKTDAENETARVAAEKAESTAPAKTQAADPTDHKQPLTRFTQAAKERWADVPEEAQKEIHRAFREVEAGLTKHREGSTRYNEVFKEFDDIAKSSNVDSKATLQSYVTIDRALHSGDARQIVGAINEVFKAAGVDPRQYAEAVLGGNRQQPNGQQPTNQQQAQPSAEVIQLRKTVEDLQKQIGGVTQHIQGEVKSKHEQTLTEWSADKPHFAQLRGEVTRLVKDEGLSPDDAYASALVTAQEQARTFLGDSAVKPSSRTVLDDAADELAEQIDRGSKSIKGAASAGSSPPRQKGPLPSIKESIRRNAQRLA